MILEPNRAAVAVDRRMPHIEDGQDMVLPEGEISERFLIRTGVISARRRD